jgi:hypothetical protein
MIELLSSDLRYGCDEFGWIDRHKGEDPDDEDNRYARHVRLNHPSFLDVSCLQMTLYVLPLPEDYEPCGECGYDHAYEYTEAWKAHHENIT